MEENKSMIRTFRKGINRFFGNFKDNILNVVTVILFLFLSALPSLFFVNTTDYRLEHLAHKINDYNKISLHDESFSPTILNIKASRDKNYYNLLNSLYYNSLNGDARIIGPNVETEGFDVRLMTSDTFSIRKTEEKGGGYYIDRGLYYSYYSDDILGPRQYLVPRFGCDSFIFICDRFADKLVSYYEIDGDEPYKTLINDRKYCVLEIRIGAECLPLRFCINNIIYSSKRQGGRTSELYGDFALIGSNSKIQQQLGFEFEVDLKDNSYCIKNTFKIVDALGYNKDNSELILKKFDDGSKSYIVDDFLSGLYIDSWVDDGVFNVLAIVVIFLSACALVFISILNKNKRMWVLLFAFIFFFIYGVFSNFVFIYHGFSICPILLLIILFITYGKEVITSAKSYFSKSILPLKENRFFSIRI